MYDEYLAIEPATQFVDQTTIKKSLLTKNVNLVREHPYPDGYIALRRRRRHYENGMVSLVKHDFDN